MLQQFLCCLALLVCTATAEATLYTVGAGGTQANIQGAIDAALLAPSDDEIRIASGTFTENLDITPGGTGNRLNISGGWNATFDVRSDSPSVVDGGMSGHVANIFLDTGDELVFENLIFQNGKAALGGGLEMVLYGDSVTRISDCQIINNIAEDDRASAGGLRVIAIGTSRFSLLDSLVSNNQVNCSGTIDCRDGGLGLQAESNAQITISRNSFVNNSVTMTEGSAFAGGANISAVDSSVLLVEDNQFIGNSVTGTGNTSTGLGLALSGDGQKTARRNRIEGNVANTPTPAYMAQMSVFAFGSQTAIISDTVVVDSDSKGIVLITGGESPNLYLVNLTVANNASVGIQATKNAIGGELNLSNSISTDNGNNTSLGTGVTSSDNLTTGTAGFVNAAGGDYSLNGASTAIDAGSNAPPGGLGPSDIAGNGRVSGGTVDLGAYEFKSDTTFEDGFEKS